MTTTQCNVVPHIFVNEYSTYVLSESSGEDKRLTVHFTLRRDLLVVTDVFFRRRMSLTSRGGQTSYSLT